MNFKEKLFTIFTELNILTTQSKRIVTVHGQVITWFSEFNRRIHDHNTYRYNHNEGLAHTHLNIQPKYRIHALHLKIKCYVINNYNVKNFVVVVFSLVIDHN